MSFSAWEQDALDSIKSGLTDSDPALAAQLRLPWRPDFNALVYVLAGSGSVGPRRHPVRTG